MLVIPCFSLKTPSKRSFEGVLRGNPRFSDPRGYPPHPPLGGWGGVYPLEVEKTKKRSAKTLWLFNFFHFLTLFLDPPGGGQKKGLKMDRFSLKSPSKLRFKGDLREKGRFSTIYSLKLPLNINFKGVLREGSETTRKSVKNDRVSLKTLQNSVLKGF
jgi:hypothetical protein